MFKTLLRKIENENLYIDDLIDYKDGILQFTKNCLHKPKNVDIEELAAVLEICLDYYTYSTSGDVMIPDALYDQLMEIYKSYGNDVIVHATSIGSKKWDFIQHKVPGVVGTIDKIYTHDELVNYVKNHPNCKMYIIAPKYDGVSCSIEVRDNIIVSAATRYDGFKGQDITRLVKMAGNVKLMEADTHDGFYKCELCVTTESYDELIKIHPYSNRRSATSGIVNTPSNLELARFITIVPLAYYDDYSDKLSYAPPYHKKIVLYDEDRIQDLQDAVDAMSESVRSIDFRFRVDGVIIHPYYGEEPVEANHLDLMENAIAFKSNTSEASTIIKHAYFSVGRMGKAVPMLKVEPVEVNETIVSDVSVGSYDKFLSMGLLEEDAIIVYSAGDVIPQIKLPPVRTNYFNREPLFIDKHCPYCGFKLGRINNEYYCLNDRCIRVITGRVSNFFSKLGLMGFSDKTFESIYNATGYSKISEYLSLTYDDIYNIEGFEKNSSTNLVNEISRIKNQPIAISKLIGAIGIDKLGERKCRRIFEEIKLKTILTANDKEFDDLYWNLKVIGGIGPKSAIVFIDFCREHQYEINSICNHMLIKEDIKFLGNVVFTGFRDDVLKASILKAGYEVSDSVTAQTVAVITASLERPSSKMLKAQAKNIPVHEYRNSNQLVDYISR